MTTYTAAQAASKLGCSSRTIRRAADSLGVGQKLTARLWIVSETDLEKIAAVIHAGPGRPRTPQEMAAEIARLRDLLDRISTEAPGAIPACNCGEGEACNRCEIRHLLDIYNGRGRKCD